MEEEVLQQEEVKITGRDKFLERMKQKNPEYAPESDDMLLDDIESLYAENEGQLNKYSESNQKLAELISRDPKIGAVLSMIAGENPKSFPYAVAKVYGKEVFELEGEELEEFEQGYQENLEQVASSRSTQEEAVKNIETYKGDLQAYGQESGKSEEEVDALNSKIFEIAENMLNGIIPKTFIELVDKGINYDQDVQEAADTGFVEGKNEKIDLKKKDVQPTPDLNNVTGMGNRAVRPKRKGSFYDEMTIEK
jgi:hypothetical protein